jgi:hypothetical protein
MDNTVIRNTAKIDFIDIVFGRFITKLNKKITHKQITEKDNFWTFSKLYGVKVSKTLQY